MADIKGCCYGISGNKTLFEQNEWHGFSKDGYSSSITVDGKSFSDDTILFHSHWSPLGGGSFDIDYKEFPFDGARLVRFNFEINEDPSPTSYEYTVKALYTGYSDFCNAVDKFAKDNVEALSGYSISKLTEDVSESTENISYWYTFQALPIGSAKTYYNYKGNLFSSNAKAYYKTYWLKK